MENKSQNPTHLWFPTLSAFLGAVDTPDICAPPSENGI